MSVQMCIDSSSVNNGLASLYTNKQLTDIRIVCSDGSLMAHRIVLASVSDKLLDLITTAETVSSKQLTIIFANIAIDEIKPIIDCIYFGQQSVETNRFKHLTKVADSIGIRLVSAVSAAFGSDVRSEQNGCPNSLPANQNTETIDDKCSEATELQEMPIDLSLAAKHGKQQEIESNVNKIIDLIATNGPTVVTRRRKQMDPKPSATKLVRFDQIFEPFVGQQFEPYDTFADQFFGELNKNQNNSEDINTDSVSEQENSVPIVTKAMTTISSQLKTDTNSNDIFLLKQKPIGRPSKTLAISDDQLKDCSVCGQKHSTHKQLINHLNKEHKTDDQFSCAVCEKQMKYAKTFAVHSIQCQNKTV